MKIKNIIILEMSKIKTPFILTLLIGILSELILMTYINHSSILEHNLQLWEFGNEFFIFLLPLFCSIPFCFLTYHEFRNGYLKNIPNRISLKTYLRIKYWIGSISCLITIFIIQVVGLIVALYVLKLNLISSYEYPFENNFFEYFMNMSPLLYGLVISFWRSLICILFYSITYHLLFLSDNIFVILTGAFIYYIIDNYIFSVLGIPQLSLITSINPNRLFDGLITFPSLFFGPLICMCFIYILRWNCKKLSHYKL